MGKPYFTVNAENFALVTNEVGTGKIIEVSSADAGLIARHISVHADTLFVAASGVSLSDQYGVFQHGSQQVAVEWVRHETKPKTSEPECNIYRYLFGMTSDGKCIGMDVTELFADSQSGQVADHWSILEEVANRYRVAPN